VFISTTASDAVW